MKENRFYVYALLDPRKPGAYEYEDICFLYEPFYIGKGSKNRCYDHFRYSQLKNNTFEPPLPQGERIPNSARPLKWLKN